MLHSKVRMEAVSVHDQYGRMPIQLRKELSCPTMENNGSPNTPPPATAPKHAYTSVPSSPPVKVNASGSAIGIQIAKVPQEDPVANAMIAEMMKIIAGSIAGVRKLSLKDTI